MRQARAQDGEAFAVLFSNDQLESPVKLDLKLIEADQVATPTVKRLRDAGTDGIVYRCLYLRGQLRNAFNAE